MRDNDRPNVVYILTDQWRAKATGYNGDPNAITPNIDRLAAESVWRMIRGRQKSAADSKPNWPSG